MQQTNADLCCWTTSLGGSTLCMNMSLWESGDGDPQGLALDSRGVVWSMPSILLSHLHAQDLEHPSAAKLSGLLGWPPASVQGSKNL